MILKKLIPLEKMRDLYMMDIFSNHIMDQYGNSFSNFLN